MSRPVAVIAALFLVAPCAAMAQDFDEDEPVNLDEPTSKKSARKQASTRSLGEQVVREIERGFYLKAAVGSTIYVGPRSAVLQPGTTLDLVVGQDFIDKPKLSVAWELAFYQASHNARYPGYEDIGAVFYGNPNVLVQGDTHVFGGLAGFEVSGYPLRRLGIGARLGGGVAGAPLLIPEEYYADEVVDAFGGAAARPPVHDGVLGAVYVGPTLEYYTKLSHFSIGLDVDFLYVIGLDYGLKATGFFKYSF